MEEPEELVCTVCGCELADNTPATKYSGVCELQFESVEVPAGSYLCDFDEERFNRTV